MSISTTTVWRMREGPNSGERGGTWTMALVAAERWSGDPVAALQHKLAVLRPIKWLAGNEVAGELQERR